MKSARIVSAVSCLFIVLATVISIAQEETSEGELVYIIFDASGSMREALPDGTLKIDAAREVLTEFVKQDFDGKQLALRAYGHRRENDCSDTELVVPFSDPEIARQQITSFATAVTPKGMTPIGRSLREALGDFGQRSGEIILISDGIETCGEDPCKLAKVWKDAKVAIRIHVVGLGLNEKEKAAMNCIARESGTEYLDAQTTEELSDRLGEIHSRVGPAGFYIRAKNADGKSLRVEGTAKPESGTEVGVASHRRHVLDPGSYLVEVGVKTRNGNLYQPVNQIVKIGNRGSTVMEVVVVEPPSVRARFFEAAKETRGSQVSAFHKNKKLFDFRAIDRVYIDPGSYEFRASPNDENQLSVTATIGRDEHKEVVFTLAHTVRAKIKMVASASGIDFRENYSLWQNEKQVKSVHWVNGVKALPGTYDLHLGNPLTPYVHRGLILTEKDEQEFRIEVPCGHVTVIYQDKAGGRDKDERCWLERKDGEKWVRSKVRPSGEKIPLVPGSYRARGWTRGSYSYDDVAFTIAVGDEKEIVLRNKE